MNVILALLFVVFSVVVYVLPAGIAFHRDHPQQWAILALNLLLGWTVIFWVASLVWALTAIPRPVEAQ